jgi:hypothetical protein
MKKEGPAEVAGPFSVHELVTVQLILIEVHCADDPDRHQPPALS